MTFVRPLVAMLALVALAAGARAQGVIVDKSEIAFTMKQMGVKFDGRFRKWKADVVFKPQQLAASKAVFDIDLASIDLASAESEGEAQSELWFDSARFPTAHFASTAIRDLGGGRYEIAGKLSIKGITRDCVVPVTMKTDAAGNRVAEGSFAIRRLDYRIGEGEWADTGTVDNDVLVRVRLVLPPA
ncbi:MAG TPA: YceI family protein [Casimicrobiaceae bacterium]|jgi:polyisoprenoid-binding protein YceI|nr:YceI family protein [Casimicrobiaceae bacterium]HWC44500.1 YceI family protein [Casimicrobiaceae bacterium]